MRPIALLGNLEIITSLAKSLAAEVHADLADAQGESGLARAEGVEKALSEAGEALAAAVQVALLGAGERAAALRKQVQDAAVARVLQMLSTGALSLADLGVHVAPAMKAAPAPAPAPATVPTVAPASEVVAAAAPASTPVLVPTQPLTAPYKNPVKFFDPASGAGWSGRGPLPKWLAALLVDGKTLEDFRVGAQLVASSGGAVTEPVASSEAAAQAPAAVANEAAEATPVAETAQTAATGGDAEGDASFDAGPAEAPEAQQAVAVAVAVAADAGDAPAASLDIGDAVSFDVANFDDVVMPKAPAADDGMGEFIEFFATMPGALHQTPAAPAL